MSNTVQCDISGERFFSHLLISLLGPFHQGLMSLIIFDYVFILQHLVISLGMLSYYKNPQNVSCLSLNVLPIEAKIKLNTINYDLMISQKNESSNTSI